MRLYEIPRTDGIDSLVLAERPEPEPGPHQVAVRIRAVSLNYRDLVVVKGGYGRGVRLPLIPLSDGAGEVVAVGEGVTRAKPGDPVAGIFMQTWLNGEVTEAAGKSALGGAIDGMLAEQVVLHEDGLVVVPERLSWEEAACLPCAAVTAWNALMESGRLRPGDTVLTLGSGGVSLFALQFARLAGARVIATTGSDAKADRLRAMGAMAVINYKATPDWSRPVRELSGGGVDHVVEVGGAGTLEQSLRAVRPGGTISFIGVVAGGGNFNPNLIFAKSVRVQGIYVGSRAMFEAMNRAIVQANLRPVVDRVFPFEEAREAYRYLESGAHFGKVCIRL
ncbi:MAG: NAD(P)-dependent alcohol dehydrogenase [Bryobacteraceae bacterium]|nr:NAD(P)-dependent alcohol dehydrogenase [Bryobacteraceae bacterium]